MRHNTLDKIICEFDTGLRTLLAKPHSLRPHPDQDVAEATLSESEKKHAMLYSPSNPPAHTLPVNRGEPHQVKFLSPKMGQESCFAGRSSWLWVCCGLLGGPGAVCSHPRDWPVR